jgi:hypothetical protein
MSSHDVDVSRRKKGDGVLQKWIVQKITLHVIVSVWIEKKCSFTSQLQPPILDLITRTNQSVRGPPDFINPIHIGAGLLAISATTRRTAWKTAPRRNRLLSLSRKRRCCRRSLERTLLNLLLLLLPPSLRPYLLLSTCLVTSVNTLPKRKQSKSPQNTHKQQS